MRGISFKAVAVAFLATLGLDICSGIVLTLLLGAESFAPELTEQQMNDAVVALSTTRGFLIASLVFGTLTTVVGGYIAARMAQFVPYLNAFVFGLVGIIFGALMAKGSPLWFNLLGFAFILPAALLGGHIAKRRLIRNS